MRSIRRFLDTTYLIGGAIGAAFLIAILILIVLQMMARWTGEVFSGSTDYAGYCMAGASFLALAYAFDRGSHIRVNLVLSKMTRWRRFAELWCYGIAALAAVFFARYAVKTNFGSHKWNDISQGLDATPIWIPQLLMSAGTILLAVVVIDHFLRLLFTDHDGIEGEGGWTSQAIDTPILRYALTAVFAGIIAAVVFSAKGFDASVFTKTVIFLFILFFLLGSGVWVGLALMGVAYVGMIAFTSRPAGDAMITTIWTTSSSWTLTALPLFIWMGEILFRSRLSQDMFRGLAPWMSGLPGGLLHTNVVGCTIFAAVSGSSAATLMTVGKMSMPELRKRQYPEFMTIGTLAGSATLGLMIPPSLTLIVYGVSINESITQLFLAGVLPGLVLAGMFMMYCVFWYYVRADQRPSDAERASLIRFAWAVGLILGLAALTFEGLITFPMAIAIYVLCSLGRALLASEINTGAFLTGTFFKGVLLGACMIPVTIALAWLGDVSAINDVSEEPWYHHGLILSGACVGLIFVVVGARMGDPTYAQKIRDSRFLIPVVMLVLFVIGSMYGGWATATEAAAIGVIGALILAALQGSLNWHTFTESLMGATRTSAMIALILMGAAFLSLSMGFTGLPTSLAAWIGEQNLSPIMLIAALTVFYIIIGMFLDGISAVVLTMAVVETMVRQAGIDMIWFGIFIVVVVEMAQITPPIGFNLFVLQGMTKDRGYQIGYIAKTALPMFLIMVLMVAVLVAFPEMATWLPQNAHGTPGG